MSQQNRKEELDRELEAWDPAEHYGPPRPAAVARARGAMLEAMNRPGAFFPPPRLAWMTGALLLATTAVVWQLWVPGEPPALPEQPAPLRMQIKTSNGTRIYWTVHPASTAVTPRNGGSGDET